MNTRQTFDGQHSNEEVSPKRHRALYEKAAPSCNPTDVAMLNNLGVDCFEHGVIDESSNCFRNAMSIFAPSLPQSLICHTEDLLVIKDCSCEQILLSRQEIHHTDIDSTTTADVTTSTMATDKGSLTDPARQISEYDEGMNSYNRPLRIECCNSPQHSCYAYHRTAPVLLFNIGQLHVLRGDDTMATNYFMYALDIVKQRSNSTTAQEEACEPISVIPILHNLGHIYYRAQNYKLAMSMYSKALGIAQQSHEMNLPALASALNCLGVIFFHMSGNSDENNVGKALDLLSTSLNIRKNIQSSSNNELRQEIATVMNNVGRVHYMKGDHFAALQTYVEAYELRKELLPKNHLDLAASAYNLGQTHHQLGNLDKGKLHASSVLISLNTMTLYLTHILM